MAQKQVQQKANAGYPRATSPPLPSEACDAQSAHRQERPASACASASSSRRQVGAGASPPTSEVMHYRVSTET